VVDLAIQAGHVANLGVVYAVAPEARSRATTVYMTAVFLGGAAGSLAAATTYGVFGWGGAVSVSSLLAACAFVGWLSRLPLGAPAALDEAYPEAAG
jgi:cyanate permease